MSEMTILLFSIGPVQDFIAAARKTKDLFAGSLMLSYLSGKAIDKILDEGNKDGNHVHMIFPATGEYSPKATFDYDYSSIPNRFLVDVTNYPFDRVDDLAGEAKQFVLEEFRRIADTARGKLETAAGNWIASDPALTSLWNEQVGAKVGDEFVNKFLEFYWVVLSGNSVDYGALYREAEQLLGKRKALRDFDEFRYWHSPSPLPGQPNDKCTLIPGLSAVYLSSHENYRDRTDFWRSLAKKEPSEFRSGERLSPIALTKRYFLGYLVNSGNGGTSTAGEDGYPSTTTIAAASFNRFVLERIADADLRKSVGDYAKAVRAFHRAASDSGLQYLRIRNIPFLMKKTRDLKDQDHKKTLEDYLAIDSDYLLDETYLEGKVRRDFQLSKQEFEKIGAVTNDAVSAAAAVRSRVSKLTGPGVSRYYAIITFDGDEMGKWLSGAKGNSISPKEHERISDRLRRFSARSGIESPKDAERPENVYDIVERTHLGKVVYSGGDDVLAFVPLEDCLNVARKIREEFQKWMEYDDATGSMGIAIAHHQMNLQQVLQEARRAEHISKEDIGRDAVVFSLLKRSGEHSTVGAKWFMKENVSTTGILATFCDLIRNKALSPSFVHDLDDERLALSVFERGDRDNSQPILSEVKRLLFRHAKEGDENKKKVAAFAVQLGDWYSLLKAEARKQRSGNDKLPSPLQQLTDLLKVGQFIGQGGAR